MKGIVKWLKTLAAQRKKNLTSIIAGDGSASGGRR
jgi:hypothetical protein